MSLNERSVYICSLEGRKTFLVSWYRPTDVLFFSGLRVSSEMCWGLREWVVTKINMNS